MEDWNEIHKRHLAGYDNEITRAYDNLVKEVSGIVVKAKIADELFSFAKNQLIKKRVDKAIEKFRQSVFLLVS